MSNEMIEKASQYSQESYDTIKELYSINTKLIEQLVEQQFALASLGVEYTTSQMKLAADAKGYKDILEGETSLTSDFSSKFQGIARNTLDIMSESKDEVSNWVEKSAKEAEKTFTEAAKSIPVPKVA